MLCQFRRKLILSGQVVCFLSNVSIFISRFPTCCLKFRSAALACLPIRHALFSTALVCNTGPATGIDGLTPKQCSLVQQSQCNGKWHQTCTCIHFNHVVHKSSRLWAATALVTGGTIAFQVLRSDTSAKTMQKAVRERRHRNCNILHPLHRTRGVRHHCRKSLVQAQACLKHCTCNEMWHTCTARTK